MMLYICKNTFKKLIYCDDFCLEKCINIYCIFQHFFKHKNYFDFLNQ
jgi:hypothetical protein